jgi:hypothetical protein
MVKYRINALINKLSSIAATNPQAAELIERLNWMLQINQAKQCERKTTGLLTMRDVERQLALPIQRWVNAGYIDPPTHYNGPGTRRRYYSEEELPTIKAQYEQRVATTRGMPAYHAKLQKAKDTTGYRSLPDVAALCGVSNTTIRHHIKMGRIGWPSHELPGANAPGRYYTPDEAEKIKQILKEKSGWHANKGKVSSEFLNGNYPFLQL